jgi:hypothetical protein
VKRTLTIITLAGAAAAAGVGAIKRLMAPPGPVQPVMADTVRHQLDQAMDEFRRQFGT